MGNTITPRPFPLFLPRIEERNTPCIFTLMLLKLNISHEISEGVKKERLKFGYGLVWEAGQDFTIVWGSALELDYIYK